MCYYALSWSLWQWEKQAVLGNIYLLLWSLLTVIEMVLLETNFSICSKPLVTFFQRFETWFGQFFQESLLFFWVVTLQSCYVSCDFPRVFEGPVWRMVLYLPFSPPREYFNPIIDENGYGGESRGWVLHCWWNFNQIPSWGNWKKKRKVEK